MQDSGLQQIIQSQRQFFATGKTQSYEFRLEQLSKLKSIVQMHEDDIITALCADLKKPRAESLVSEFFVAMKALEYTCRHLKKWMRDKKVPTPFSHFPGHSFIHFEPYGVVLIISPWNYPFLLALSPLNWGTRCR